MKTNPKCPHIQQIHRKTNEFFWPNQHDLDCAKYLISSKSLSFCYTVSRFSSRSNHVTSLGLGGFILININNAKTQTQHNTTAMNQPNEPTNDTFPFPRLYTFKSILLSKTCYNMFALWLVLSTLRSTKPLERFNSFQFSLGGKHK